MSRKRNIPWETRISIFLDYRRLKKVYPTAKRQGIARSTVSAIVNEFKDMGFSEAPRPDLSPPILTLAQEHHLRAVMELLQHAQDVKLFDPGDWLRGGLAPEDALGDQATLKASQIDPIPLDEALVWHLKGTEAGQMIQEVKQSIVVYGQRCLELWRDIRANLEESCSLPVRTYDSPEQEEPEPHIFHLLVDEIYRRLLHSSSRSEDPSNDFPRWNLAEGRAAVLRAGGTEIAIGAPADHQAVQLGVQSLLRDKAQAYSLRLAELTRLDHDLQYVKEIIEEVMQKEDLEEVGKGVCPACPYPEAGLALVSANAPGDLEVSGRSAEADV